jgi:hypothetical protein
MPRSRSAAPARLLRTCHRECGRHWARDRVQSHPTWVGKCDDLGSGLRYLGPPQRAVGLCQDPIPPELDGVGGATLALWWAHAASRFIPIEWDQAGLAPEDSLWKATGYCRCSRMAVVAREEATAELIPSANHHATTRRIGRVGPKSAEPSRRLRSRVLA